MQRHYWISYWSKFIRLMSFENFLAVSFLIIVFISAHRVTGSEIVHPDRYIPPTGLWKYPPELPNATIETYKKIGDVELKAYIFQPDRKDLSEKRPAIVYFFGGGWQGGTPGQFFPQCQYFSERGMVAITVDYRVGGRNKTKAAIRWMRTHADRLGIDPKRIVASGGSAGGHLAAATAIIEGFDEPDESRTVSSAPNLLVLYNPALQLAALNDFNPLGESTIKIISERLSGPAEALSPIHHIRQGLPPSIIFHGESDEAVPVESIRRFKELMDQDGNECRLITFEGRPHGFFNTGRGGTPEIKAREVADHRETTRLCDQFLIDHKYLRPTLSQEVPETVEAFTDLVYKKIQDRELKLDLYLPKNRPGLKPAVIVVHGGGWLKGSKEQFRPMAIELARRGFVAATVEYRLGTESRFPAAVQDCNGATQFLRANATKYGIDPERIGAVGGSAGGHLVGLMATGSEIKEFHSGSDSSVSSRIHAGIVLAGPMELATGPVADRSRTGGMMSNANQWIGKTVDEAPDLYRLASPFSHLSAQTPPLLFLVGELDSPERNQATRERLREFHIPTGVIVFKDGKHGCWNRHPYFLPMVDEMHNFFETHLK
jgi:acetyl esterase/lipase